MKRLSNRKRKTKETINSKGKYYRFIKELGFIQPGTVTVLYNPRMIQPLIDSGYVEDLDNLELILYLGGKDESQS